MRQIICVLAAALGAAPSLPAQPTAQRVTITRDLRLDANVENFSSPGRFSVGPRGQIAIPLFPEWQIRLYDSTGNRIAAFGRGGAGPGEFGSITSTGWVADTLWAFDWEQRRMTYYSSTGRLIRTAIFPIRPQIERAQAVAGTDTLTMFIPSVVLSDGSFLGEGRRLVARAGANPGIGGTVLARVAPNGSSRVFATPPRYEDPRWYFELGGLGHGIPFAPGPLSTFAFDGTRIASLMSELTSRDAGAFTVTLLRATGDTVFRRSYPFRGKPIPQKAIDSALAEFIPKGGEPTEGTPDLPRRNQAMAREKMPAVYHPTTGIIVGRDNTVWIMMRDEGQGPTALVLNSRGDPIATVQLPPRSRIRHASATQILVTEADADGLTSIVRYRVTGVSCSPVRC